MPNGLVAFLSPVYPGSTTDKELVVASGLLEEQGARSAPCSRGPGTSEVSALSPPQAKNFGLGAHYAPRLRGPGTSKASALSPPQAKMFGHFSACKTLRCNLVIEFSF